MLEGKTMKKINTDRFMFFGYSFPGDGRWFGES